MLKRREERDTYLIHICRHHWSGESPVERLNIRSFQPTLWISAAVDVDSSFHCALSATAMSHSYLLFNIFLLLKLNLWLTAPKGATPVN